MKKRKFAYLLIPALLLSSTAPVHFNSMSISNGAVVKAEDAYEAWSAKKVYNTGDKVVHNGKIWEAQWYTQNEEPGTTGQWGVWQERGTASSNPTIAPTQTTAPGTYPAWDSQLIYDTGDIVSYGGKNWIAGWYTINDVPGTTGQWGVWQEYTGGTTTQPTVAPTVEPTKTPTPTPVPPSETPTPTPVPPSTTPTPSQTVQTGVSDGWYYIKNVNAGKYLQVAGNRGANAQNVEIGTGTGVDGQKWLVTNQSDGTVAIESKLGNFALDIANGTNENAVNVQIYSSWGPASQRFYLSETATNGVYYITTKVSEKTKCLDVAARSTADGANVQQYTINGGTNQHWIFEKIDGSTTPTNYPTNTPTPSESSSQLPKPSIWPSTTYNKMIANSLVSTGNNNRFAKAIMKAQRGEDVTIAYIGGSITEGASSTVHTNSYAYQFYSMFKQRFAKGGKVNYVNAGMSGTPSSLGVIRYSRDVAPSNPDIVFVEFAVNDADDETKGDAYESLVRNILQSPNKPACMLIFSVFKPDWNLQDRMIPVGKHYNLPMVSIRNAVVPAVNAGQISSSQFWANDGWHPVDYGHKLMADCIMYCVDQMLAKGQVDNDISIPNNAAIGKSFENMVMIESTTQKDWVKVNAGGFNGSDNTTGNFAYNNQPKFKNVWKHYTYSGGTSFTMDVNCKSMLFAYKLSASSSAGKVDIYIDGKYVKTVDSYKNGGWNNPWVIQLMNNSTSANHKVEIRMANGSANKEFTILGFGVSR